MKVLMIAPGFSIHAKRPLRWLLDARCAVTFMDHLDPAPDPPGDYRFIPFPKGNTQENQRRFGSRVAHDLAYRTITRELRPIVQDLNPDVVHVHWVDRRAWHCLGAECRPLVLSVWGSDINSLLEDSADQPYRELIAQTLAGADRVIVDTSEMADKCHSLTDGKANTELIHLGIDTELFRPLDSTVRAKWRSKLAIDADATVFFSARAWSPLYGHHRILEAFANCVRQVEPAPVLLFKLYNQVSYPEASAYESQIRKRVEKLGLEKAVRFIEEVSFEQLPEIYALSDVVVNDPSMDTFPIAFLEAAACQRPVISRRLPSYEGTFADQHFQLVKSGNRKAMATAMVGFVQKDQSARARGLGDARRSVQKDFDQSVAATRLLDLYEELARTSCARNLTPALQDA